MGVNGLTVIMGTICSTLCSPNFCLYISILLIPSFGASGFRKKGCHRTSKVFWSCSKGQREGSQYTNTTAATRKYQQFRRDTGEAYLEIPDSCLETSLSDETPGTAGTSACCEMQRAQYVKQYCSSISSTRQTLRTARQKAAYHTVSLMTSMRTTLFDIAAIAGLPACTRCGSKRVIKLKTPCCLASLLSLLYVSRSACERVVIWNCSLLQRTVFT